jgi:hypothetical protein
VHSPVQTDDKLDETAGDRHKHHVIDGCSGIAKVRVAGSSPVVRSKPYDFSGGEQPSKLQFDVSRRVPPAAEVRGGVHNSRAPKAIPWVESFGGRPYGRSRRLNELGELVSRGRIADVYEAHDRLLGRIVAIQVLAPAFDRV